MNEMRKLIETVERAQSGSRSTRRLNENSIGKQQKAQAIYDYIVGGDFDLDTMMDMGIRVDDESVGEAVDDWIGSLDSREFEEMYQDAKECQVSEAMTAMRESDPSVRRSLRGRPLTDFEVEYHLTLNVTVEAEDQEDAREVFFEEFEREQMHLHEGELTIYDAHGPEARARFRKSTKEQ